MVSADDTQDVIDAAQEAMADAHDVTQVLAEPSAHLALGAEKEYEDLLKELGNEESIAAELAELDKAEALLGSAVPSHTLGVGRVHFRFVLSCPDFK